MTSEAKRKLAEWRHSAAGAVALRLHSSVDLSVRSSAARVTVPGVLPSFLLGNWSALTNRLRLPSLAVTSLVSFIFGVAWTLSQLSRRTTGVLKRFSPLRVLLGTVLIVAYVRFVRWRQLLVDDVIRYMNYSRLVLASSQLGDSTLTASNSQLVSHGDTPFTFLRNGATEFFDAAHYTGDAVIVDISDLLEADAEGVCARPPLPITRRIMEAAIVPGAALSPVWRLLLVTGHLPNRDEDTLANGFAYMEAATVRYLAELYPSLLLIGTDALLVDDPATPSVADSARGALDECGIAVLGGLCFAGVYPRLRVSRFLRGSIMTLFNGAHPFDEVRGCRVVFFPSAA
ncbi:arylformamidase [Trypanosoma rangeli]|uniref:Arylformamidase n=1 Tax=Trypanosoma rangeli TaxID=5698 RepID=A0A422NIA6_TRYRA|nr:arylformamidase [Trypanosoma rangeli]RNF05212.1 arylformamidase [Trypanosoma rangeli]|eukprot:RNF05212.1 arylformamidase [Trypanosoma rangeli]